MKAEPFCLLLSLYRISKEINTFSTILICEISRITQGQSAYGQIRGFPVPVKRFQKFSFSVCSAIVRWKLNVAFEIDDAAFVYIITKLDFAK